ncbi:MAG: NUDIX hydrolase [Bacilli bacterium]|nr:NUDIX hydrolase [Bacilli bacterium]
MKLEEKQLTHKLVYECFFLKMYEDEVLLPNEKRSSRIYIMHNSAAAVLPITKDGKIVLVKQYRYPIRSESIEIPAGKKDYLGEDGFGCAMRELEEETGYVSNQVERLMDIHSCVGYSNEMIEIFIAKDCIKKENPLPSDDDEFLELLELSLEEVKSKVQEGIITDAKTLVALQHYFLSLGK